MNFLIDNYMKPEHVKKFEESISYPEYTEEDKKRGMNNKDLDFMTKTEGRNTA